MISQDITIIQEFMSNNVNKVKLSTGNNVNKPVIVTLNKKMPISDILQLVFNNFHHIKYIRTNNGKFRDTNIDLSVYACQLRTDDVSNKYVVTTNNDILLEGVGSGTNATNSFILKFLSLLLSDNTMISTLIFNKDVRLNQILAHFGITNLTVNYIYNQLMATINKFTHRDINSDTRLPQVYMKNDNGEKVMLHVLPNSSVAMRIAKEIKYYHNYNFDNEKNFKYNRYHTMQKNYPSKPNLISNLLHHTTMFSVTFPHTIHRTKKVSNVFKYGYHISIKDMCTWRKAILEAIETDENMQDITMSTKKMYVKKAIMITNHHFKNLLEIIYNIKSDNISGWTDKCFVEEKYANMKHQKYLLDSKYDDCLSNKMYNKIIRATAEDFIEWFINYDIHQEGCNLSPRCVKWLKRKFVKYFSKY